MTTAQVTPVEPTIPRTVKVLSLVSLFNDFASEMVYPLLPAFIVGVLGGSATFLAALDGSAELAASLTKVVGGRLADRKHLRKPLIVVGYFTAILVRPFMAVTSAAVQVVALRTLDRVGKGLRTPARDSLIADLTVPEVRGRAYGLLRGADHFGSIPGSLLAWWLLANAIKVRQVLAWSLVPGLVAGAVLMIALRAPEVDAASAADKSRDNDGAGRTFWVPVTALAMLTLLRAPETLLLLRLQQLGVDVSAIPLVWAGLHVVRTAVSYPGGWMTDRAGSPVMIAMGGALFAAVAALLAFPLSAGVAVSVFMALGVVAGLTESAERALVASLSPKRSGRGFGAYHGLTGLAALPAAIGFGFLFQHDGGGTAMGASAAGMLLATLGWTIVIPGLRHRALNR